VSPGWPNGGTRRGESPVTRRRRRERTRGTETSQYPEEEKSTEMPSVAASERGGAQTAPLVGAGLQDPRTAPVKPAEVPWNGAPEAVRAR
jgi:hypothetical protein